MFLKALVRWEILGAIAYATSWLIVQMMWPTGAVHIAGNLYVPLVSAILVVTAARVPTAGLAIAGVIAWIGWLLIGERPPTEILSLFKTYLVWSGSIGILSILPAMARRL
jgi:hypothetical protein